MSAAWQHGAAASGLLCAACGSLCGFSPSIRSGTRKMLGCFVLFQWSIVVPPRVDVVSFNFIAGADVPAWLHICSTAAAAAAGGGAARRLGRCTRNRCAERALLFQISCLGHNGLSLLLQCLSDSTLLQGPGLSLVLTSGGVAFRTSSLQHAHKTFGC